MQACAGSMRARQAPARRTSWQSMLFSHAMAAPTQCYWCPPHALPRHRCRHATPDAAVVNAKAAVRNGRMRRTPARRSVCAWYAYGSCRYVVVYGAARQCAQVAAPRRTGARAPAGGRNGAASGAAEKVDPPADARYAERTPQKCRRVPPQPRAKMCGCKVWCSSV